MFQTLRHAVRSVLREPLLALLSIAALGLGIGLPTAMFSLVDGAVLRGLPIPNSERILHLERRPHGARGEGWGAHPRDLLVWQERQRAFEGLAAFHRKTVTLRSESGSDRQNAALVTPNTFVLLGASPLIGRSFTQSGAEPEAVLSHHVWRDRFASAMDVVGKTVFVDGEARVVIGVMPEDFRFPDRDDLWLPLRIDATAAANADFPLLDVFGKLQPGVSRAEAEAQFAVIAEQTTQLFPESNRNMGIAIKRFTERFIGETATITMYVMLAAVLLVLIVACINVANLLLVRAVHRGREIAIRAALGGTRRAITRQLFAESLVLAIGGGLAGILIASLATTALAGTFGSGRMPYWVEIRLDARALLFAAAATIAAAIIAAILPAMKATTRNLSSTLLDTSRGGTSMRVGRVMRVMIALEIALSMGLLAPAVMMLKGLRNLEQAPLTLAPANVFTAKISLPARYDDAARVRYFDALRNALVANPGVTQATVATTVPTDRAFAWRFAFDGVTYDRPDDRPRARRTEIGDDFFTMFGAAVQRGRGFGPEDRSDTEPVAIVNTRFVERYLEGKEPLGQRIRMGDDDPWRRIIGVVPNLWAGGMDASADDRDPAAVYLPLAQATPVEVTIAARSRTGDPVQLTETVRQAAFALDPDVPIYQVRSMPQLFEDNSWFYSFGASIMLVCALSALLLAMIGLYGVVAFSVGQRTREFGIRMAVGAISGDIVRLVLRQGTIQIVSGIGFGLVLAIVLSGGVASLLFGVRPTDPIILAAVAAVLTSIALAAMLIPAVRAARTDPLSALREA